MDERSPELVKSFEHLAALLWGEDFWQIVQQVASQVSQVEITSTEVETHEEKSATF